MSPNRPFVVSIAGFDPAGAGVLTDIKTFEQHRVYGFAITTANTIQTENQFLSIQWTVAFVLRSIEELFKNYPIKAVKIGIVPSLLFARNSVSTKGFKKQVVWDTVLKSSTEYDFLNIEESKRFKKILKKSI
jgi:hydroxymethylpyrimidine/phosphomethylpyrimidine kinase